MNKTREEMYACSELTWYMNVVVDSRACTALESKPRGAGWLSTGNWSVLLGNFHTQNFVLHWIERRDWRKEDILGKSISKYSASSVVSFSSLNFPELVKESANINTWWSFLSRILMEQEICLLCCKAFLIYVFPKIICELEN
jgi:hypothetical protein